MSRYIGIEELLAGDARDLARFAAALDWQVDCVQESPFYLEPECCDEILRFTISDNGDETGRHTITVQALGVDCDGGYGLLQWRHHAGDQRGRWQCDLDQIRRLLLAHGVINLNEVAL